MALLIATMLLAAFALLAVIDGFYLHLFKYQLFNHVESTFEHKMHTIRAVLFPLIVYFLFLSTGSQIGFYVGIFFVLFDIVVLVIDAFVEQDSRSFMGGLPRWEYILHLFVNGFHFASIAVFLSLKLQFTPSGITILADLSSLKNYDVFQCLALNLLPGAILLAIIHVWTCSPTMAKIWNNQRAKITCC